MNFATAIRPHVSRELARAASAEERGDPELAFSHLERAHVLGQPSTREHVRVHWAMLGWGIRHRRPREVVGQVLRIAGAATKTALGLIPTGNTGGANISPFKPLPVPPDLQELIERSRVR
ncbi:MAG: DUF3703 domain-containing protein [Proteobacteria bacterium]|nr:DUF3703 domain-containing protein [Pseudomonadota bacterium]